MTKRYAPPVPNPSYHRQGDTLYFLELLNAAGLSQRKAGPALGLGERSIRYKIAGESEFSYPEQYCLEVLADAATGVQESAPAYGEAKAMATEWYLAADRPLARSDVGKWIVGKDQFGVPLLGELAQDGFGLVLRSSEGLDVRKRPVDQVAVYTLLDPPPAT